MDSQTSLVTIQWTGNQTYTLTTSYANSDIINIDCDKSIMIYPFYTGGAGSAGANTMEFEIDLDPLSSVQDPSNTHWQVAGGYSNDGTGKHTPQDWYYQITQAAAGVLKAGTAVSVSGLIAKRLRIKAKETVAAGSAGTAYFLITKSNYL